MQDFRIEVIHSSSDGNYTRNICNHPHGIISNDLVNYLTATYDGTNGISYLIEANANCSRIRHIHFKVAHLVGQDLTAETTFRVNFVSEDGFDDTQVWFEAISPTSTSDSTGTGISTRNPAIKTGSPTTYTTGDAWRDTYTPPFSHYAALVVP